METADSSSAFAVTLATQGSGTLGGTTTVTAAAGVATFAGLTLSPIGSGYTLQVSGDGLNTTSNAVTVAPSAATQLSITPLPSSSVAAGTPFSLVITAKDANNNVATGFSGIVVVSLSSNPGGAILGGTLSVSAVGGIATFAGLTINIPQTGYTLQVSSGNLSTTSQAVTVIPGAATQLDITAQPPTGINAGYLRAGDPFGLEVEVKDALGNPATNFSGTINAALASNASGAVLVGATTATVDSNGIATFSGLIIDTAGIGYTIVLSRGSLKATTDALDVAPAVAYQLVITAQPPASVVAGIPFGLTVSAEDQYGNVATDFSGDITATLNQGGNPLGVPILVQASNGVATFAPTIDTAGTGYNFVLTGTDFPAQAKLTSGVVSITPAPAAKLIVTIQPTSVSAGAAFLLAVEAEDSFGNTSSSFSSSIDVVLAANPGEVRWPVQPPPRPSAVMRSSPGCRSMWPVPVTECCSSAAA